MGHPSRTLQTSIFEPLYSQQEELHPHINQPISSSPSHWPATQSLSSPFSSPAPNKAFCNNMRRAPATIFNDHISADMNANTASCEGVGEHDRKSISCDGLHSSSGSTITISTATHSRPSRSHSSSDVDNYDDGSIASKLLTSITKSISSPSLLACCKESARETPYQKALKLRRMKLQHCAEELGSESSDGSPSWNGESNIFDSLNIMSSLDSSTRFSTSEVHQKSEGNASSMMISVRSSPNLRCTSFGPKHTTYTKERLFPPPLTHNLHKSASSDSFSYSLRAYREDGRFVLKEIKVPCRQYLQANRKDGRLTLQLFTPDEDLESKQHEETSNECQYSRDLQEDEDVDLYQGDVGVAPSNAEEVGCSSCDKIEVKSDNTANLVGELEVCRLKESKKIDHVGICNIDEYSITIGSPILEKVGCLSAKSFLMAAFNSDCGDEDVISQVGASSMRSCDFTASKHKAEKEPHAYMSNKCPSSRSLMQQAFLHPPGKIPRLRFSHDFDVTSISQCEQNLVLQGNSTRGISNGRGKSCLQRFEIASASLQESGYGVSKSTGSTIIFKEVSANCLMEEMTKLVNSFGLDGGKWCGEKVLKTRELDRRSSESGRVIKSSMYNAIKSINIGVREIDNGSPNGVRLDIECERELRSGVLKGGRNHSNVSRSLPNSSFHFDVQIPSSTYIQAALKEGNGWIHTLHCKELFDRNQLAKGFMKLHCVAIRS